MSEQYIKTQRNVGYIDINAQLLNAAGQPDPKLLKSDNLHPSPEGYHLIAPAIRAALAKGHVFTARSDTR